MNTSTVDPILNAAATKFDAAMLFAFLMVCVMGAIVYLVFQALQKERDLRAASEERFAEVLDRVADAQRQDRNALADAIRQNTQAVNDLRVTMATRGIKNA